MTTATVDDRKRVRIPDAKPGQVFSIEAGPDGSIVLRVVEPRRSKVRLVKPVLRDGLLVLPVSAGELDAEALDREIREERDAVVLG